jgi:hypothetical protein
MRELKAMMTRRQASAGLLSSGAFAATQTVLAQESGVVELPPPRTDGGKRLIQALSLRRSIREYADKPLAAQVLSDLFWAAFGINRPAMGDRTAPYWRHVMVIDIYAAMADAVWLYEPKRHALVPHLSTDIRAHTGTQDFVGSAPLNLLYVAHGERMQDISGRSICDFRADSRISKDLTVDCSRSASGRATASLMQINAVRPQGINLSNCVQSYGGEHVPSSSHRKRICRGINARPDRLRTPISKTDGE